MSNGLNCDLCEEPTAIDHPDGDAPHAPGCTYGDGFTNVSVDEARAIAVERTTQAGGQFAPGFIDEFWLTTPYRDIVIDGVLHARDGNRVLVRRTSDATLLFSMTTGDLILVENYRFRPVAYDVDGNVIDEGALVEDITYGRRRGIVTGIISTSRTVFVKGRSQYATKGDHLRVIPTITLRWETRVVESHQHAVPLADVAKALGIATDGKATDEIRQEVEAVIEKDSDVDAAANPDLDGLIGEEEGTTYAEDCHPSTESRVLLGHGEG